MSPFCRIRRIMESGCLLTGSHCNSIHNLNRKYKASSKCPVKRKKIVILPQKKQEKGGRKQNYQGNKKSLYSSGMEEKAGV